MKRKTFIALIGLVLISATSFGQRYDERSSTTVSPAVAVPAHFLRVARPVPGEYIIRFAKDIPQIAAEHILAAHHATVIAHLRDINAYWVSMSTAGANARARRPLA